MTTSQKHFRGGLKMEIFEGNPIGKKLWDAVWKLDFMKPGNPGISPTSFGDGANVLKANILQMYGGEPSVDGKEWKHWDVERFQKFRV